MIEKHGSRMTKMVISSVMIVPYIKVFEKTKRLSQRTHLKVISS